MKFGLPSFLIAGLLAAAILNPAHADTLDAVKERGEIKCGISDDLAGFAFLNDKGNWEGFDVDYCRAFSAAIFGTPDKVDLVPIVWNQVFTALNSGTVDVLSRSVTYTIQRDAELDVNFLPPTMFTGQGFMTRSELGVETVADLNGASICVLAGSVTERYLADYFRAHDLQFTPVALQTSIQVYQTYLNGRCDAMTHETVTMGVVRGGLKNPEAHVVLDEIVAKSFQAPLVREGDDQWYDIIKWTHFALVTAEELGITQENIDKKLAASENPIVRTFLGKTGDIGKKLGLRNDWAVDVIRAVGNYGEIYSRNLGKESGLNVERGMNALYQDGGLLYAPSWN